MIDLIDRYEKYVHYVTILIGFAFIFHGMITDDKMEMKIDLLLGILMIKEGTQGLRKTVIEINNIVSNTGKENG